MACGWGNGILVPLHGTDTGSNPVPHIMATNDETITDEWEQLFEKRVDILKRLRQHQREIEQCKVELESLKDD